MKKILSLALVVMFVFGIATTGFSEVVFTRGADARVLTESAAKTHTTTLSTNITTNNRILGFTYSDEAAGCGAIYDATAANANAGTGLIGEIYVAAGTCYTIMFPLPRNITTGLSYAMSTSTGSITIYYE